MSRCCPRISGSAIAEEPLGAGVPTDDPSLGIDRENGEILDALDHEPEIFLGLAQRLLDTFPLGDLVLELAPPRFVLARDDSRLGQLALGADLIEHAGDDRLEVVEEIRRLGHEVAHAARRASISRFSSLSPVTRMAGTLWPASLTWRKNSRPLVPEFNRWSRMISSISPVGDLLQPFLGRRGGDHRETGPLQPKLLQPGNARVILHEQDRCPGLRFHGCS